MIVRKNKQLAPETVISDELPFDRGFWSGKKGSAVGSTASGNDGGFPIQVSREPVFANQRNISSRLTDTGDGMINGGTATSYPADLRREGPFAKDKFVVPKATIDPQASQAGGFQSGLGQSGSGVRTIGSSAPSAQKRILQLDDFEPQTKAWRRTQKEPVAPRVHPNPTPVVPVKAEKGLVAKSKSKNGTAAKAGKFTANGSAQFGQSSPTFSSTNSPSYGTTGGATGAPAHASTDKPSIVMPLAMIFTLIVLIGGGYVYLSKLSEENSQQQSLASRERQVKLVETMLLNLDYQPGIMDGKVDNSLTNAVKAFQRDSLLEEDGLITPQLIIELEAIIKIYESS